MTGRPDILFPLFGDLQSLDGVGPKIAKLLADAGWHKPRDLLMSLPYAGVNRCIVSSVMDVIPPTTVTVEIEVGPHKKPRSRSGAYRVSAVDGKTAFQMVFFHARGDYLERQLPVGSRRIVSGKIEIFDGLYQMVHPDYMFDPATPMALPEYEPVYHLTAGVTQKTMFKAVTSALERVIELAEWIDPSVVKDRGWPAWNTAMHAAHRPGQDQDLLAHTPARERLAYDEFFAHQLTLAIARSKLKRAAGQITTGNGALRSKVLDMLPYSPTQAQTRAIREIAEDLAKPLKMNRLLQGDVGAGKTLVAFMALLICVEAGGQGAMMAPTEILARQHLEALKPLAEASNVVIEVLTGRDKGAERRAKLAALEKGDIQILVGTHALFQKDVVFHDLRLAIVDEQHRFGVRQRLELGQKGRAVDVLVMTATPIPRSLALSQYGDMDVSILDEKPPGRKPIKTVLVSNERLDEIVTSIRRAVSEGKQVYWVCPLVEESEVLDYASAEDRFKHLRAVFGEGVVELVHGQMPPAEKDSAMARFAAGDAKVLVATTVIEVGVNVPNATIMVIERAEIFGLAQLHQLRGRVGRGDAQSNCVLLYQAPLSKSGQRRLEVMRETEDGFVIAQTDLELRGAGDLIGTEQSGVPRFRIADLEQQSDLMYLAQKDARMVLDKDPNLETERGKAIRVLLWLMEQEKTLPLISVG